MRSLIFTPFHVSNSTLYVPKVYTTDFRLGGSVTLNSSDPFTLPLVDINMLGKEEDVAVLREAIRSTQRLYSATAFQDTVFERILPAANVTSDSELDAYIRSVAVPFVHAVGSAGMTPRGASWGVVDPDFRVKGTTGLRIVDASVIVSLPHPYLYSCNFHRISAGYAECTYTSASVWVCGTCEFVDREKLGVDNSLVW